MLYAELGVTCVASSSRSRVVSTVVLILKCIVEDDTNQAVNRMVSCLHGINLGLTHHH